jgi:hypothetical protein
MMVPLTVPEVDAPASVRADWLELHAFFSADGRALLRELAAQADLAWDNEADAIDEEDAQLEDALSEVAGEIDARRSSLGDSYPFAVSGDGALLSLAPEASWTVGHLTYLFSLVLAHARQSDIVSGVVQPTNAELTPARNLFQICGTLAAAGHIAGPAICFGFPRPDASGMLKKLKETWALFRDGVPREQPLPGSEDVKDEGIDVVAWRGQPDKKPTTLYVLGQVASGNNWRDKTVKAYIDSFHEEWFAEPPAAEPMPTLMIPFLLDETEMRRHGRRHGTILDRGRLPRLADLAPELEKSGISPIDRLGETEKLRQWLASHRARVLGAHQT